MKQKGKRVVVGLSGGVDSSVAAHLLVEQGYEVIGLFMKNWHDESVTISAECPWLEDSHDAMLVAEKLGIPFQTVDLSEQYKVRIVDYMFDEYANGRTPNPDVLCNREIKFDVFLKIAQSLGADYVATGHYCQRGVLSKESDQPVYQLLSGADPGKDQSYFLCQLNQEQLSQTLFPIGHLQKSEVRAIAHEKGLITAEKKDSQGLCFIGKVRLPDFLQQQLKPKLGKIIEISPAEIAPYPTFAYGRNITTDLDALARPQVYQSTDGEEVGEHQGAHYFTIGQRKGLAVGGTPEPLFVIGTDVEENIIYVGQGNTHPGLFRPALKVSSTEMHWVRPDLQASSDFPLAVEVRIRYRQPLQKAYLYPTAQATYWVFEQPQSAITSGQFAAAYIDQELVCSGVIA